MNRIVSAAALTVALWGLARWLDRRYVREHADPNSDPNSPTERRENEGGPVSLPGWTQSSQARRS